MSTEAKQKILIIDDEKDVHYSFRRLLQSEPLEVLTAESGDEGLKLARKTSPDLIVMDIRMGNQNGLDTLKELRQHNPKQIIIMMTAYGTSQTAIEAMKRGAYDYILKPFQIPQLKELLARALQVAATREETVSKPTARVTSDDARQTIVGNSTAMQEVYKLVGQVAPTSATVLLTGESGTGKELVARAIHQNSPRTAKTFIPINCAAIPENLLESELFGHEKGAFTGAMNQRIGKFEQCDGGTLLLDEIGDMPMTTQTKILRVLQEGEISRVGSNQPVPIDVRIIAATNKDLWEAVAKKEFREDLYYRLNVVRLQLPPLRDRLTDLPLLVPYFINKHRAKNPSGPTQISDDALACLQRYTWPGNVRELENCIQRAMVLATGTSIQVANLPSEITRWTASPGATGASSGKAAAGSGSNEVETAMDTLFTALRSDPDRKLLPVAEKALIERALRETQGNQKAAAEMLGLNRATLHKRIGEYGLVEEK